MSRHSSSFQAFCRTRQ